MHKNAAKSLQREYFNEIIFIIILGLLSSLTLLAGIVPQVIFQSDIFLFLNNSYCALKGQIPHKDFSSPWGPTIYIIYAVGLALSGMRPEGIGYANALFGVFIAGWTFVIARSRWSPIAASALGIYAALLIMAPFAISQEAIKFTYAMHYNRYGYGFLGILLIECAAHIFPARSTFRANIWGGISTGIILGVLTYLKLSYALATFPLFMLSFISCTRNVGKIRLIGMLAGYGITNFFMLWYLQFDIVDMLNDLAIAGNARRLSLMPSTLLEPYVILENAFLFLLTYRVCKEKILSNSANRIRIVIFVMSIVASGCLLLLSNQQLYGFPLNAYIAVIMVAAVYGRENIPQVHPLVLLLLGLCLLPLCVEEIISLTAAVIDTEAPVWPRTIRLTSPENGGNLTFVPVTYDSGNGRRSGDNGKEYVRALNNGFDLLRAHTGIHDGVLVIDMLNPFNYLLNRPPPKGGIIGAGYNYTFSDSAHVSEARFFGNAKYVMVRKYKAADIEKANVDGLLGIYGSYLYTHFILVEESDDWMLLSHK